MPSVCSQNGSLVKVGDTCTLTHVLCARMWSRHCKQARFQVPHPSLRSFYDVKSSVRVVLRCRLPGQGRQRVRPAVTATL